jgi:hypothetical protein
MKYRLGISHIWKYRKGYVFPFCIDILSFHMHKHVDGYGEWWGQFTLRILNIDLNLYREKK